MNALGSIVKWERKFFERYFSTGDSSLHRCPVCRVEHKVSAARAQFAYGKQMTCGPDCEAERRRQVRAAYRRMGFHAVAGPVNSPAPSANRLSPETAPRIALFVTVESKDAADARKAVFLADAGPVDVVKMVPVPHSSKVRLLVCANAQALEKICTAVVRAVPAGEFSRISHAPIAQQASNP